MKVGAVLRYCAYEVMALHGILHSEIQVTFFSVNVIVSMNSNRYWKSQCKNQYPSQESIIVLAQEWYLRSMKFSYLYSYLRWTPSHACRVLFFGKILIYTILKARLFFFCCHKQGLRVQIFFSCFVMNTLFLVKFSMVSKQTRIVCPNILWVSLLWKYPK